MTCARRHANRASSVTAERQVCLAHSRRTQEDHVLLALDEARLVQALDCSRLIAGWNVRSESASVLIAGSLEERIAVCNRRLLRSLI
jgi:hypothetical protein